MNHFYMLSTRVISICISKKQNICKNKKIFADKTRWLHVHSGRHHFFLICFFKTTLSTSSLLQLLYLPNWAVFPVRKTDQRSSSANAPFLISPLNVTVLSMWLTEKEDREDSAKKKRPPSVPAAIVLEELISFFFRQNLLRWASSS